MLQAYREPLQEAIENAPEPGASASLRQAAEERPRAFRPDIGEHHPAGSASKEAKMAAARLRGITRLPRGLLEAAQINKRGRWPAEGQPPPAAAAHVSVHLGEAVNEVHAAGLEQQAARSASRPPGLRSAAVRGRGA
jgi:hypothetical protein